MRRSSSTCAEYLKRIGRATGRPCKLSASAAYSTLRLSSTPRLRCTNCNKSSEHPSTFFELSLPLQGHVTIDECLKSYVQKEFLDGDNKYFCSHCSAKHDATRQVVLKKLPDLLNIGLLRFVFDLKTLSKKKLTSSLQFPETMDLSEYLPALPKQDCIYDLQALLLHRGPSAYHGHYVAQIRDLVTGSWAVAPGLCLTTMRPSRWGRPRPLAG